MRATKKINSKVVTLAVLVLIAISAVAFRPQEGEVLGVTETVEVGGNGTIGSGASTVKSNQEQDSYTGKALWDDGLETAIIGNQDKFKLGQEVSIKSGQITRNYIITESRKNLTEETLVILNTETFIALGGNPESSSFIEVVIEKK